MMINFPNQFLEGDPNTDLNILKKITTPNELSGIFNWGIDGLTRLLNNDNFTRTKSAEDMEDYYLRASEPVKTFTEEETEPTGRINAKTLYEAFTVWCKKYQVPPVSYRAFNRKISEVDNTAQSQLIKNSEGNMVKHWNGIELKTAIAIIPMKRKRELFRRVREIFR